MTKHTMVMFQLHRKGVILIAILALVLAVLLVAAGYFAGRSVERRASARRTVSGGLKPAAPLKPVAKPAPPKESFALRVALVATEEEASAEVKRLKVKKLAATIVPVETSDSTVVYQVRVGPYPDRQSAIRAAEVLQREHGLTAAVVPAE